MDDAAPDEMARTEDDGDNGRSGVRPIQPGPEGYALIEKIGSGATGERRLRPGMRTFLNETA